MSMENNQLNLMRFLEKKKSIPLHKQKEIIYRLVVEGTGKIEKLHNSVNFINLIYNFKGPTKDIYFNDLIDAEIYFGDIKSEKNKI